MESAKLLNVNIDLEEERHKLVDKGLKWGEIRSALNKKYRSHSDKNAFMCACCNKAVKMVLHSIKVCHFRHLTDDPCPGEENYKKYKEKIKNQENEYKHRVGKTILKSYLEGQLRRHNVEVKEGYSYQRRMRVIPDMLLCFPTGEVWAIDYVTGTKQDENYNHYIKKRIEIYQEEGFRPFFFIDIDWLSTHPSFQALSVYLAENEMKNKTQYDVAWEEAIQQCVSEYGKEITLPNLYDLPLDYSFNVNSLVYIDTNKAEGVIARFMSIDHKWVYLIHKTIPLPLERITSLNDKKDDLLLHSSEEQDHINDFKKQVYLRYEKFKEEELRRKQREEQDMQSRILRYKEQAMRQAENYQHPSSMHDQSTIQSPILDKNQVLINRARSKFQSSKHRLTSFSLQQYSDIFNRIDRGEAIEKKDIVLLTSLFSL
jgi:hypothetical protein